MAVWRFVTNHALVLSLLDQHPSITARELALRIGITERAVRKIIADLESEGYIAKEKEGRRVRYSIDAGVPMRHPTQRDKSIGNLLHVLGGNEKSRSPKKSRVA